MNFTAVKLTIIIVILMTLTIGPIALADGLSSPPPLPETGNDGITLNVPFGNLELDIISIISILLTVLILKPFNSIALISPKIFSFLSTVPSP